MAKVAKKGASSAKKSGATKKVVAKKVEKQKKTAVKVTSSASKKKVEKKVVPAKKAVVKKAPVKVKPAAKKTVSKPVAKKTVSKPVTKSSKPLPKAKPVAKPLAKKAVLTKAPVKAIKEPEVKKKPVVPVAKFPAQAVAVESVSKTAAKPRRAKKKKDDDDDDEEVVVFRKPAKAAKSSSAKKSSAKYVSEELTLEGPGPTRIGPIVMSSEEKLKLKKALLHRCIDIQKNNVSLAKKAMDDALSSANEEKVTEELSDSFRESMHATRDMYARQAQEGINNLGLLNRIMVQEHDKVKFGSVVFTNFQNYFISTSLGEIKIDEKSFQTVSTLSPLFQILADKRKGDTFMFLDRLYTVIEVF
ncbi:MAG: hypothetical protein H7259_03380 [Cytophagales bacterium]|nr:hypothetical protein [Cytophaga sp.]